MKTTQDFDRVSIGVFPTPVQKLDNVSRLLGTQVYVKRDDLTGLGLGGNKVRKLEYLLADAKAQGAEVVFTTGGAQSNHAMLTAAAARKLGMTPILILKKRGVTARQGNQLLEHLMGVDVRFMDTDDYADIYAEMDRVGAALGAVIMSSISRILVFIGLPSTYDNTITGIMLIVIVVVDALAQRRSVEMARRKRLLSRTAEHTPEGGAQK